MPDGDRPESAEDFHEDEDLAMPDDEKPKTGRELYQALLANGFIGAWKDRADIGDNVAYARRLRRQASKRMDAFGDIDRVKE